MFGMLGPWTGSKQEIALAGDATNVVPISNNSANLFIRCW